MELSMNASGKPVRSAAHFRQSCKKLFPLFQSYSRTNWFSIALLTGGLCRIMPFHPFRIEHSCISHGISGSAQSHELGREACPFLQLGSAGEVADIEMVASAIRRLFNVNRFSETGFRIS